jgi:pimeloyl-ACP methyl ester carboxylesterase
MRIWMLASLHTVTATSLLRIPLAKCVFAGARRAQRRSSATLHLGREYSRKVTIMFNGIRTRLAAWRNRRATKRAAEAREPFFYDEQSTTDTIVFVHGIIGHYSKTWANFPKLLHLDLDLPRTDIWLWGYRSTLLPFDSSVKTEAKRLMSDLRVVLPNAQHIFLVGHSMGGLAILEGVVDELREGRAAKIPVSVARHIALYATPALGSEIASVIKLTVGIIPRLRYAVNRQVHSLSGDFVNDLIREVAKRIYSPTIAPGDESSKRKIPITACVGTRDLAVTQSSAKAIFDDQPPIILDAGHFDIKEPISRRDRRYLALKNILVDHYAPWFRELAQRSLAANDRKRAAGLLLARCEHAIEARLRGRPDLQYDTLQSREQRRLKLRLLRVAAETARDTPNEPMGSILNAALLDL